MSQVVPSAFEDLAFTRRVLKEMYERKITYVVWITNSFRIEYDVVAHLRNLLKDITGNGGGFLGPRLNCGIQLRQRQAFIDDFELEPRGDELGADGGSHDGDGGRTVIDFPPRV